MRAKLVGPITFLGVACVAMLTGSAREAASAPDRVAPRPNIVVIVSDDQRWDALWGMPTVTKMLGRHGVTFTNAFTVNPLCCPSRASLLTGRYAHSTGVYLNRGAHGGFTAFDDTSTLATALHDVGYTTGLFGKYLNDYGTDPEHVGYVPPGWDTWSAFFGGYGYYDYWLAESLRLVRYGSRSEDYSTSVLARRAVEFVHRAAQPFLLVLTPYAPHEPATAPRRYEHAFEGFRWWRPPSFDERDVNDKPAYVRGEGRLTRAERRKVARFRVRQLQAALAVDDAVFSVLRALESRRALSRTVIVYMSDNGVAWGEHALVAAAKSVPYEEPIRIPLVVRYDPVTRQIPRTDGHLVLNLDIAPTLAELAGATLSGADGRSLVWLLGQRRPVKWRRDFLVEHLAGPPAPQVPTYCAVRTERYKYVLYQTGEQELYDLLRDPHELRNLAGAPQTRALQQRLLRRLQTLCRPAPPGYRALADLGSRR